MNEKSTQAGNPEAVEKAIFGSSDSFFEALENNVNGAIVEDTSETKVEATQNPDPNNTVAEDEQSMSQNTNSELEQMKKRYSDSSREAQRMKAELNELQPFVPVLNAMKRDSGLVSHVRDYFDNGGAVPDNVQKRLKLDEDFQFDPDDMVKNPDSDSRKVFNTMVDGIVQKRANEILDSEKQKSLAMQNKIQAHNEAEKFREKYNMSKEDFVGFAEQAKNHFGNRRLTFDEMYVLLNQGQSAQNVAQATKADMLNQMKNVRDIPTSQSSVNAAPKQSNPDNDVFEQILGLDNELDNMFG